MKLENVLKELEANFGWSFHDEKGNLHLEDMQKELLQDTLKAVKNLGISVVSKSVGDEHRALLIAFSKYCNNNFGLRLTNTTVADFFMQKSNL